MLIPVFLFPFITLFAQELKVEVFSGDEPLAYAYVSVNGRVFYTADEAGIAKIPQNSINTGDTVSASFVGMSGGTVIYGEDIRAAGVCRLNLESLYRLEDVVVYAKKPDAYKLYRKYVNRQYPAWVPNWKFDFNFSYKRREKGGNTLQEASGDMTSNIYFIYPDSVPEVRAHRVLAMNAAGDTTNVGMTVASRLHGTLSMMAMFYFVDNSSYHRRWSELKYLGEEEQYRVFTVTNKEGNYTGQLLVKVDKRTRQIKYSEWQLVRGGRYLKISANFKYGGNYLLITDFDAYMYDFGPDRETLTQVSDIVASKYNLRRNR